jgi:hypothetical protein
VKFIPNRAAVARAHFIRGNIMKISERTNTLLTLMMATAPTAVVISAALARQPDQQAAAIPRFSGTWVRPYFGVELPLSGPRPVTNTARRNGVETYNLMVGDHTNPILKPEAAEAVKKHGEIELSGVAAPNPRNSCWPGGVPFVFAVQEGMLLLQQPDKITIVYDYDHQVRHVRMNEPHPSRVTPSWYGDSVGHWEGDTLVIDTIGVKSGPFAMLDIYGTPYTDALHVVERYRLIDHEAAIQGQERGLKEHPLTPGADGLVVDPNYKGNGLQLQFTVEDDGAFTTPWSATVTYRRGFPVMSENICAEDPNVSHHIMDGAIPRADRSDF